jgi:hypothetical protein
MQGRDTATPLAATPGTLNVLAANQLVGKVKFVGANAIGPQVTMELTNVMFRPANVAYGMIQDEWGNLQVTGEVLVDPVTGFFGTITHPDTTAVSPLTTLYYIGKGIVSVQILQGITPPDSAYRDVGNVPVFEFTPNITVLSHYSSRLGIRSKDLEVIHEKQATLNMHMDEFSFKNLQLAFMAMVGP